MTHHERKEGVEYVLNEFVSGWFWLAEQNFNDLWERSSRPAPTDCEMMFRIETLELQGRTYVWDVKAKPTLVIRSVGLSFVQDTKRAETQSEAELLASLKL